MVEAELRSAHLGSAVWPGRTHIIGNGEFMSTGLVTGIQSCGCREEKDTAGGSERAPG